MESLTQAAVAYLNAGLSVIALTGKQPNTLFHRRGLLDAISGTVEPHGDHPLDSYSYDGCPGCADREQLERIFGHRKTTGIGIPIPEHLVVVDIDGEEGAQQWRDLARDELIPETPVARTGRGLHMWYFTSKIRRSTKLGPKLDLKGVGGYVAVPPSRHFDADGNEDAVYEWLAPLVGPDGMLGGGLREGFSFLPPAVEVQLDAAEALESENGIERHVYTLFNLSLQGGCWRLHTEPVPPVIDGLLEAVRKAAEGNRNNMLAWATLQARDEGLKLEDALRELGAAAAEAGLTARETRTTIVQAYRRSRE
jgi:hypothetical protein